MLNLYQSKQHQCSYINNHNAITVFADPKVNMTDELYEHLLKLGFQHNNNYVYTPKCPECDACISVRVKCDEFKLSRNQKRIIKRNADLGVLRVPPVYSDEHFQLYHRYLSARHSGGGMEDPSPADYMNFLTSHWCNTVFFEFRLDQKLMAVMVVDELHSSLSAVYTFFDFEQSHRSLGHFAILQLIENARASNKPWVYLGYYIRDCDKMKYKDRYHPLQAFIQDKWQELDPKR